MKFKNQFKPLDEDDVEYLVSISQPIPSPGSSGSGATYDFVKRILYYQSKLGQNSFANRSLLCS